MSQSRTTRMLKMSVQPYYTQAGFDATRKQDHPPVPPGDDRGTWAGDAASRENEVQRHPMLFPTQQQLPLVNPIELLPSGRFYKSAALSKVRLAAGWQSMCAGNFCLIVLQWGGIIFLSHNDCPPPSTTTTTTTTAATHIEIISDVIAVSPTIQHPLLARCKRRCGDVVATPSSNACVPCRCGSCGYP